MDAQPAYLAGVRVRYVASLEHVGGSGDFGDCRAHQPAGAAFGDRDGAARGTIGGDNLTRFLDQDRGKEAFAHEVLSILIVAAA